jgi:hypothetical protein
VLDKQSNKARKMGDRTRNLSLRATEADGFLDFAFMKDLLLVDVRGDPYAEHKRHDGFSRVFEIHSST